MFSISCRLDDDVADVVRLVGRCLRFALVAIELMERRRDP